MRTFFGILFETLTVLALVAANGFFVAAEFALVKVRTSQLRPLEKTGGWRVKAAIKASEHLDAALSATQLGITLASLGLGWIGEPFLAHRLGPLLALAGIALAAMLAAAITPAPSVAAPWPGTCSTSMEAVRPTPMASVA